MHAIREKESNGDSGHRARISLDVLLRLSVRDRGEHGVEHRDHARIEHRCERGKRDRYDAGQNCVFHRADTALVPNEQLD